MTTLLIRTRNDRPPEGSPRLTAPLAPAALAPDPAPVARPAEPAQTFGALLLYYVHEVLPSKAASTQSQQTRFLGTLDSQYGHLPLTAITSAWLRTWRDQLSRGRKPD